MHYPDHIGQLDNGALPYGVFAPNPLGFLDHLE
jgi:hypothetical protein